MSHRGKHRKADRPGIWWFRVWELTREYPLYHSHLYHRGWR